MLQTNHPKLRAIEQYPLLLLTIHSWLAASADLGRAWLGVSPVTEEDTERKHWSLFCNKSATLTWIRSSTCCKYSTPTIVHCVTLSKSLGASLHCLICTHEDIWPDHLCSPFCSDILIVCEPLSVPILTTVSTLTFLLWTRHPSWDLITNWSKWSI